MKLCKEGNCDFYKENICCTSCQHIKDCLFVCTKINFDFKVIIKDNEKIDCGCQYE